MHSISKEKVVAELSIFCKLKYRYKEREFLFCKIPQYEIEFYVILHKGKGGIQGLSVTSWRKLLVFQSSGGAQLAIIINKLCKDKQKLQDLLPADQPSLAAGEPARELRKSSSFCSFSVQGQAASKQTQRFKQRSTRRFIIC